MSKTIRHPLTTKPVTTDGTYTAYVARQYGKVVVGISNTMASWFLDSIDSDMVYIDLGTGLAVTNLLALAAEARTMAI